jgi:trehalose 6-phosphate synthase/phosphatase
MRLVLVCNRLPVTAIPTENGYTFQPSAGGVATGLRSYLESISSSPVASEYVWIGWPGSTIPEQDQDSLREQFASNSNAYPIYLSETEMENFYHGFCNKTIWALFHYFPAYTIYEEDYWQQYKEMNERYCQAVLEIALPDDLIWVHDYHLMLLPYMIRQKLPESRIGFFLHTPFPSYEVFRLLPSRWRNEILKGLLGADLVGFHTHDYVQYFLRCVLRLLGLEHSMGQIFDGDHIVKADTFPMGIDFQKFHQTAGEEAVLHEADEIKKSLPQSRVILSIDRLDYSKGITHRLAGYELFLEKNPEWRGKVVLLLIVVPSRVALHYYQMMKKDIDELVGRINGRFADMSWTPILYQYRSLPFEEMVALYSLSDVMLVTPLRDGMNLIAKEYIASRIDQTGVLILSEMAGAARELGEAILINPNTPQEISDALETALMMPPKEQKIRNTLMQKRLKRYGVGNWANDFLQTVVQVKEYQRKFNAKLLPSAARKDLVTRFSQSERRIILLDYDGTIVPFAREPRLARPDAELTRLVQNLCEVAEIVLITGRDKKTVDRWFPFREANLVAEHGVWLRIRDEDWKMLKPLNVMWKESLLPIMELFADRLPGSFVEEKEYSLAFHYRQTDPELASIRVKEMTDTLVHYTANMDLVVLQGSKVLELRNGGVDKGAAGLHFISNTPYDFILAIGDDWTDEDLFRVLPEGAYSLKVGSTASHAAYNIRDHSHVRKLLKELLASVTHLTATP